MMSSFPLSQLLVLHYLTNSIIAQFYVYNTDVNNRNDWQHHCLFYYVLDDIVELDDPNTIQHQIIPYCERPIERVVHRSKNSYIGTNVSVTFKILKEQQVTSQRLLSWSAPIDLVERYQMYLENSVSLLKVYMKFSKAASGIVSKDNRFY